MYAFLEGAVAPKFLRQACRAGRGSRSSGLLPSARSERALVQFLEDRLMASVRRDQVHEHGVHRIIDLNKESRVRDGTIMGAQERPHINAASQVVTAYRIAARAVIARLADRRVTRCLVSEPPARQYRCVARQVRGRMRDVEVVLL
jgi:hypothetical protein